MQPISIRAFVSIAADTETSTALVAAQQFLRGTGIAHVRWTKPDQIHLTLCFLGNINAQQLPEAIRALHCACEPFQSFELHLGKIGAFPGFHRPRVLWIGLTGDLDNLCALQRSVARALSNFGDHRECKRFHPHLTLGRVRQSGQAMDPDALSRAHARHGKPWQVSSVLFMRSELHPGGASHTLLADQPLAAKVRDEPLAQRGAQLND